MRAVRPRSGPTFQLAAAGMCVAVAVASLMQWARIRRAQRAAIKAQASCRPSEVAAPGLPARFLLIGDSAALGVGAARPQDALAGLIAAGFRGAHVHTLAECGATLPDVQAQLQGARSDYQVAVVVAGGNDILRWRSREDIAADANALMAVLSNRAATVVWLGVANMGLAPLFIPPWSWWVSARVRRLRRVFAAAAEQHGVTYVDFFREAKEDVFSRRPWRYFAADGIHPSSSTYRYCFEVLRRELG